MLHCKHLRRKKKKWRYKQQIALPLVVISRFYLNILLLRPNLKEVVGDTLPLFQAEGEFLVT